MKTRMITFGLILILGMFVVSCDNKTTKVCPPHSWTNWTVNFPAEIGIDGEEIRTCTICGISETKVIPALSNTVCEDCGENPCICEDEEILDSRLFGEWLFYVDFDSYTTLIFYENETLSEVTISGTDTFIRNGTFSTNKGILTFHQTGSYHNGSPIGPQNYTHIYSYSVSGNVFTRYWGDNYQYSASYIKQ